MHLVLLCSPHRSCIFFLIFSYSKIHVALVAAEAGLGRFIDIYCAAVCVHCNGVVVVVNEHGRTVKLDDICDQFKCVPVQRIIEKEQIVWYSARTPEFGQQS